MHARMNEMRLLVRFTQVSRVRLPYQVTVMILIQWLEVFHCDGPHRTDFGPNALFSPQPLDSLAWQKDGQKFVSAHSDSSIYYWSVNNSSPNEGPTHYYGQRGRMGEGGGRMGEEGEKMGEGGGRMGEGGGRISSRLPTHDERPARA